MSPTQAGVRDIWHLASPEPSPLLAAFLKGRKLAFVEPHAPVVAVAPDDSGLIAAVARLAGDASFTSAELVRLAKATGEPGLSQLSARKLGKRLAKIEGRAFDGFMVEVIARRKDRGGVIWTVREM